MALLSQQQTCPGTCSARPSVKYFTYIISFNPPRAISLGIPAAADTQRGWESCPRSPRTIYRWELEFRNPNNLTPGCFSGPGDQCSPFQSFCSLFLPLDLPAPLLRAVWVIKVHLQPTAPNSLLSLHLSDLPSTVRPGRLHPLATCAHHQPSCTGHWPGPQPVSYGNDFSWQRRQKPFP